MKRPYITSGVSTETTTTTTTTTTTKEGGAGGWGSFEPERVGGDGGPLSGLQINLGIDTPRATHSLATQLILYIVNVCMYISRSKCTRRKWKEYRNAYRANWC